MFSVEIHRPEGTRKAHRITSERTTDRVRVGEKEKERGREREEERVSAVGGLKRGRKNS